MSESKLSKRSEYRAYDLTAAALGLFLLIALLLTARYSVGVPDEAFYYTVPHRILLGERLIADEWSLSQFVYLFNLLPSLLFIRITGGTAGIVLFMRCLFAGIDAAFYCWMYVKLRRFRAWGIAAAFLFCAVIQQTLLAVAYFTAAPMAMIAVCLILCVDETEKSAARLTLTGVLLACGILAEPFLIVLYLLWFALTAIRLIQSKRGRPFLEGFGFALERRVFVWTTVGAAAAFFAFMAFLLLTGAFGRLTEALPYLFSGAEYNSGNLIDLEKLLGAVQLYGAVFVAGQAVCVGAAAFARFRRSGDTRMRRAILLCALALYAGSCVYAAVTTFSGGDMMRRATLMQYNNFTLLLFSPVLWLLAREKRPRFFAVWLAGMGFSVLVDLSSTVALGSGGGLVRVACVLQLSVLLPELHDAPAKGKRGAKQKKSGFFKAALAVCMAAAALWNLSYLWCSTVYKPVEKLFLREKGALGYTITEGPFKGLKTTDAIGGVYTDTLRDLDTVVSAAGNAPVAVLDLAPYTYLYMGLPYGSYSAWYEYDEPARLAAYWRLRPAQRPAVIYIPFYDKNFFTPYPDTVPQEKLNGILRYVDGEVTAGKAGYIVYVRGFTAEAER